MLGKKAAALTHQLLAFSRRQVLEPAILNLNEVILDLSAMLRRLIDENIEIIFDLDETIQPIKTDASQLELVLINLVINARDAMPDGGKINISTKRIQVKRHMLKDDANEYLPPGLYTMLMIQDMGSGIDTNIMNRIFEPFFTTKERGKGTGLGLAMVHGFTKQSKGHILVNSEIGLGTSFSLFFPAAEKIAPRKKEKVLPSASSGTETILLVEDNPEVRNITRDVLQLFGYKVIVSDALEAVKICQKNGHEPIHLLLTDIIMPQMNGRELAAQITQYCPNLKILYMSWVHRYRCPQQRHFRTRDGIYPKTILATKNCPKSPRHLG